MKWFFPVCAFPLTLCWLRRQRGMEIVQALGIKKSLIDYQQFRFPNFSFRSFHFHGGKKMKKIVLFSRGIFPNGWSRDKTKGVCVARRYGWGVTREEEWKAKEVITGNFPRKILRIKKSFSVSPLLHHFFFIFLPGGNSENNKIMVMRTTTTNCNHDGVSWGRDGNRWKRNTWR